MVDRLIIYHPLSKNSNIYFVSKRIDYYIENDRFQPESIEECLYIFQLYRYLTDIIRIEIKDESLDIRDSQAIRGKLSTGIKYYLEKLSEESVLFWLKDEDRFYDTHNFLLLVEKFKLKSFIEENIANHILKNSRFNFTELLNVKWFVQMHQKNIRDFVISERIYNILLKSLYDEPPEEYIKQLGIDETTVNQLLSEYIELNEVDFSYLQLISQSTARGFLITPRVRYKAQRRYEELSEKLIKENNGSSIEYGIKAQVDTTLDILFQIENESLYHKIYYNPEITSHINNPDILLNYLYYAEAYFTDTGTWKASHKISSRLAELFETKGHRYLSLSEDQKMSLMLNSVFIQIIDEIMKENSEQYLDLIKYFIEDILPDEYNLEKMKFEIPGTNNQEEINTMLVIGLEKLLKTYNYYVEYGEIEHEVMRFGYNSPKIENLKSQTTMYISLNEEKGMYYLAYLLFDEQSPLSFHQKYSRNLNGNNFYSIISANENMSLKDWDETDALNLLIHNEILYLDNNYTLKLHDKPMLNFWYLLYIMKSVNTYYFDTSYHKIFDSLIQKGYARKVNTLLTKEESLIFSYLYNNEKFSNGPAVRNKYAHSEGSSDYSDEELFNDYYTILLLYTIIIMKINDDCSLSLIENNL